MVEEPKAIEGSLSVALWTVAPKRFRDWRDKINLIRFRYRHRMKRELNLTNPLRFSEKMQWRKLFEAAKLYTELSDKIAVREHISRKGFSSLLIPQLWVGVDASAIPFDDLPRPFVLKSTHACGHVVIIARDQVIDRKEIVRQAQGWLAYCHGTTFVEPGYLGVPHRLVVESLLVCSNGEPPAELKVFVFDGIAKCVQYITTTNGREQQFAFFDRDWKQYPWHGLLPPLEGCEKPLLFDLAVMAAEKLCEETNHCRVDFYLRDNELYIGEMTLYSFTGMIILQPPEADLILGSFWTLRWPKTRAAIAIITRSWGREWRMGRNRRSKKSGPPSPA